MAAVTPTATANPTPRLPRPAKPVHSVGRPPHAARRASSASAATFLDPSIISPTPALIPARFLSRAVRRLRRRHRERGWRPRLALFPVASRSGSAAPITTASYASRRSRALALAPPVLLRAEAAARQVYFILDRFLLPRKFAFRHSVTDWRHCEAGFSRKA